MNLNQCLQLLGANRAAQTAAVPSPLRAEVGTGNVSGVCSGPSRLKGSVVPL